MLLRALPFLALPLLALPLLACGGGYQADTYSTNMLFGSLRFPGTRVQHGCLDIALQAQAGYGGDPTLDVSIGNRCVPALNVHLEKLVVRGVFDNGEAKTLSLYDPKFEIHGALLGGRAAARERFEIFGGEGAKTLCVSVAAITAERTAGPPQETCIDVAKGDRRPS